MRRHCILVVCIDACETKKKLQVPLKERNLSRPHPQHTLLSLASYPSPSCILVLQLPWPSPPLLLKKPRGQGGQCSAESHSKQETRNAWFRSKLSARIGPCSIFCVHGNLPFSLNKGSTSHVHAELWQNSNHIQSRKKNASGRYFRRARGGRDVKRKRARRGEREGWDKGK